MNQLGFKEAFEKEKYRFKQLDPLERSAFILFISMIFAGLLVMFGIAIGIFSVSPGIEVFTTRQSIIESAIFAKFISICLLLLIKYISNNSLVRKFVWITIFWIFLHYCIGMPSLLGSDDFTSEFSDKYFSLELWSKQNLILIGFFSFLGCILYICLFDVPFLKKNR